MRLASARARVTSDTSTASASVIRNTQPMRSMNGSCGSQVLNAYDSSTEPAAAAIAPASLARFQNRPSRKITVMPGVKKPVNSWMNWKA